MPEPAVADVKTVGDAVERRLSIVNMAISSLHGRVILR